MHFITQLLTAGIQKLKDNGRMIPLCLFFLVSISVHHFTAAQTVFSGRAVNKLMKKTESSAGFFPGYNNFTSFKPDSIGLDKENKRLDLFFNPTLAHLPLREENYFLEIQKAKNIFGRRYRKYDIRFFTGINQVTDLIPNFYRKTLPKDPKLTPVYAGQKKILFRREGDAGISHGLRDRHIALWPSHGKYFNQKLSRWEWQRPRLHTTVEDLLPAGFVIPYLAPMLENAGAVTLIPRERDVHPKEYIVDQDQSDPAGRFELNGSVVMFIDTVLGFAPKEMIKGRENPFLSGTALKVKVKAAKPGEGTGERVVARYLPNVAERGRYALYISYPEDPQKFGKVWYTVRALDGDHRFLADQSIGGGMWVYLGHFEFGPTADPAQCMIEVAAPYAEQSSFVGLDAIRIGGGMGNVARKATVANGGKADADDWQVSGLPRYMEGARYFMQYSGVPDSMVYYLSRGENDYTDDFQSRGEWVNYLIGKPYGPTGHRHVAGKGIPVDLCFAFHTDAGVTANDSVIGTLGIYSAEMDGGLFPDGRSRLAGRELTDVVQTQIVEDIRRLFSPEWVRRGLWDKKYAEAFRPNVPAMLLELLSHQNLADMVYGLDPEYRFHVSRAIYKGMLKYLSFQDGKEYVVQPLPVEQFGIESKDERGIRLSWKAVDDPLEPTAVLDSYRVYARNGNGAFRLIAKGIKENSYDLVLPAWDTVFSYRIVAENRGGVSFPSEVMSVGIPAGSRGMALVVNAFNRLSGPAHFDGGKLAGFAGWMDEGVTDGMAFGYTGEVYDVDRTSLWLDNDSPGWGASHGDGELKLVAGNTFDHCAVHGAALMQAGYGFVSVSEAAFCKGEAEKEAYELVDIIYGEERTKRRPDGNRFEVLDAGMRQKLEACMQAEKNILISGAYIGTDMVERKDSVAMAFAGEKLGYKWRSDHADRAGVVVGVGNPGDVEWRYNTGMDEKRYRVESPDAIEPAVKEASTILRYVETGRSAGVLYNGGAYRVIVLGFPLESMEEEGMVGIIGIMVSD